MEYSNEPLIEEEPILNEIQQEELLKNELALIPEGERKEIAKVVKSSDMVLISTHKKKLSNFKRRFPAKNFVITDILVFNKEVYEKALSQWQEIKNYRTKNVVPDFKNLKAPYVALTKYYNDTCNPIIEDFKNTEAPIGDFVDKMEALQKAEKEKDAIQQQQRTEKRVKDIIAAGAIFDGDYYSVGSDEFEVSEISLGMADINSMSDEIFDNVFEQMKTKLNIINIKQSEKDNAEAESERLRLQKIEDDKLELAEQQQKLKQQNERVRSRELKSLDFVIDEEKKSYSSHGVIITVNDVENLSIDEWEVLINYAEKSINIQKEAKASKQRTEARYNQLSNLGLTFNGKYESYVLGSISIDNNTEINLLNQSEWDVLIEKITAQIPIEQKAIFDKEEEEKKREKLQEQRLEKLFPYNKFGEGVDMPTLWELEEEKFNEIFENKKAAYNKKIADDAKLALDKQAKDKAEDLAKQGDQAMYEDFCLRLQSTSTPEVTTEVFKKKVSEIRNFLSKL